MFRIWFRRWLASRAKNQLPRRQQKQSGRRGFHPALESLEDRLAPAFLAPVNTAAGVTANSMAVGDFNNDGIPDIVSVGSISGRGVISVGLGNGDGTFQPAKICNSGNTDPLQVRVADFNGDGKLDVVCLGSYYIDSLTVCTGNGDGTFQPPTPYTYSIPPTEIEVGDMNGDGHPDLIEGNHFFNTTSVQLNDGTGHFGAKIDSVGVITPSAVKAADFNGDGKADIVSTSTYYNFGTGVNVQLGNGNGTLQAPKTYLTGGTAIDETTGDFNGDGKADIAVANTNNTVGVLLGNGDGTFKAPAVYNVGTAVLDIHKADFNGDGITDLVERTGTGFAVELGNIDGTFQPASLVNAGIGSNLVAADFNLDGVSDIAIGSVGNIAASMNDSTPIINQTNPAATFVIAAPTTTVAGAAVPVTVTAVDASGNLIPAYTGVVHVSTNDPHGSSMVSYLFTAADGGTHTFASGLNLFTAGAQSILVGTPSGTTASQAITVTPAAATHLALTTPSTTVAGAPMTFSVVALDAWNNLGALYTGTVHFSTTDAQGTVPADYTFLNTDGGIHAFTGTLATVAPGGQTITATDTLTPTIAGISAAVAVTPTTAVSFHLSGGGGFVGSAHTVTVSASDAFGNTDPTYTGTVHLTSSDPATSVSADVTFVNGIGTFSVTPTAVGTQTLTATDVANSAIAGSSSIVVTPGWASRFVVSAPASAVAGVAQSVTVTAYDSFGNVSTVYTGGVVLTSNDVQAVLPPAYTFTAGDAGVHAFNVTLKTATSLGTITVTDAASSALTGSRTGIVVTPAAASRLAFTYTAPLVISGGPQFQAGQQQFLNLIALDAFGNNAGAIYAGTVNLKSSDAQAVLPASYTFVPGGTNRIAVTFKTAGTDTLTATDSVSPGVTGTSSFTVGAGATATLALTGGNGAAGVLHSVTISASDAYGNFTSGYNGLVHFTSSDTAAVLPADTALVNGTGTVSVRMMTVGTQTLTATDTTTPAITGRGTISVTAALLGGFDVTGFPSTTAGAAHTFNLTVRNTIGQVMTGYTGTVVFSSSDVQAGLPASYTFTAADKGSHVFTATLRTAGLQSLFARDSVTASINGSQTGIAVTAAAAASLSITGYPATTAGVANNFTVTVRDAYGNLATGYTGTVKFTSTDKQAVLPANYRFVAADGGVHVFSGTFKTAQGSQNLGGHTLTVQDIGNVALVSSETNIIVSHATMTNFAIVYPSTLVVGTPFALKVIAQDDFGNKIDDYHGTIHFTNSAGITGLPTDYTFTSTDNGQHTYTVTLTSSIAQTVSFADVANVLLHASATLTVGATGGGGGGGGGGGSGGGGGGGAA